MNTACRNNGHLEPRSLTALAELIRRGELGAEILSQEEAHTRALSALAEEIAGRGVRAVMLAGPSSSGKTTCAHRLSRQLAAMGLNPVAVSLDDYYIDRDKVRPESDGTLDLEHINTIDVDRFRRDLAALLTGKEVTVPRFDFTTGRRHPSGRTILLRDGGVLIVEGIHGLNPLLLPEGASDGMVYRLYICPEYRFIAPDGTAVDDRDFRLLRRILRDWRTRGTSAAGTLGMWDSVGRGEARWILPYRESADGWFNSALSYEPAVLKARLRDLPAWETVSKAGGELERISRMLLALPGVQSHEAIPSDSILREFIGA